MDATKALSLVEQTGRLVGEVDSLTQQLLARWLVEDSTPCPRCGGPRCSHQGCEHCRARDAAGRAARLLIDLGGAR